MLDYPIALLRTIKTSAEKRSSALRENFSLEKFMRPRNLVVEQHPFPHIVIDNFFIDTVHEQLSAHFKNVLSRGFSEIEDSSRFQPFLNLKGKYEYDGYVYVPWPEEEPVLNVFFSVAWNLFFSKLFGLQTGLCTSMAYHHHPVGNRTGFVHSDFVEKIFSYNDKLSNGVIFRDRTVKKNGTFDVSSEPILKEWRKIALIYYLGESTWEKAHGGETGLYEMMDNLPIKYVAPQKNRLLAFEISSRSLHAFQGNFQPRSSIVQWFHAPVFKKRN